MINNVLVQTLNNIITKAGTPLSFRYYYQTIGSVYDDQSTLTQSGTTLWISGIVFPLDPRSSTDNFLLEQGKIANNDMKCFVNGSIAFGDSVGSVLQAKVGLGSPGTLFFSVIELGAVATEIERTPIYKKAYLRKLTTGSLQGE